ncbi:cytochrome ubiquinol oxidase subunit I [Bacillaceae bacterium W0354]
MWEYDPVFFSRTLTGLTLSFHIIFATIGVGVPLMIAIAQWIGIKKNDEHYILLARRWTRGFVITVAVGVVTGTAIGLQLSLLWPNFMELAGHVISLPLFMETFAFFFEAIFLGIYLYTWDRFENQKKHMLLLIPVAIGASFSAFFITMVNAFMNTPQGFDVVNGALVNVNPIAAMFNPSTPTKVAHVMTSAYMTSAFVLASIAAFSLLKGRKHIYYKKALHLTLKVGLIFAVATALIGDFSAKFLAEHQPEKLAAAEWHFETTTEAPLLLYGWLDDEGEVRGALKIPYALSILSHNNPKAEVIGLEEFPEDERPPLFVHYFFDLMVTIGVLLPLIALIYWFGVRRGWSFIRSKMFNTILLLTGPLAIIAIEMGWYYAEFGRQPWILRGYMKVPEGATSADYVDTMLVLFAALYLVLAIASTIVLTRMFKKNPVERELAEYAAERRDR